MTLACKASVLQQQQHWSNSVTSVQVDFIVAFLGVTYARAVAAPLNPNYKLVWRPASRIMLPQALKSAAAFQLPSTMLCL